MVAAIIADRPAPALTLRERTNLLRILAVCSIDDATIEPRRADALLAYTVTLISHPADPRVVIVAARKLIEAWAPAGRMVTGAVEVPVALVKKPRAEAVFDVAPKRPSLVIEAPASEPTDATETLSPFALAAICVAHSSPPRAVERPAAIG
jgi:hypothetical protein